MRFVRCHSKTNKSDRTLSIGEDFPKDIAYNRRKLFPVFTKARRVLDKKVVSLKADNLVISGKRYTVDNLDENDVEMFGIKVGQNSSAEYAF